MKNTAIFMGAACAAFLALSVSLPLQAQDFNLDSRLKKHVVYLSSDSLHGRQAGSVYEEKAAEYVLDAFARCGLDISGEYGMQPFSVNLPDGTIDSRNVVGVIPGYDPVLCGHYIVVGAHLDNLGWRECPYG